MGIVSKEKWVCRWRRLRLLLMALRPCIRFVWYGRRGFALMLTEHQQREHALFADGTRLEDWIVYSNIFHGKPLHERRDH